jgi:catechol 2,3-dioxygenase-like lactoylglutathione lyase family enzyme
VTERLITHLRHVDLAVPDFDTQLDFFTNTWGLTSEHTDSGLAFLAAEGSPEQYVVRLRQSPDKRIDLISFGVATSSDVDTLAQQVVADGVTLVSEPATLQTPGRRLRVPLLRQRRPHRRDQRRRRRPGASQDRGGGVDPVRLSHVVINSADPDTTRAFYEKHLGFALSDTLMHPRMGEMMWFLRVNAWHHSMAVARGPHPSLHHASFEMRGIDEYMRGTGRLLRAGVEKIWGPGRHLAGNNTFSYFLDPHGNTVEYTTELDLIDEDTWHPHMYDFSNPEVSDQWGTANQMNEFVAQRSFNDPDKGLFIAPPV